MCKTYPCYLGAMLLGTIDESVVGKLYSQHDWNQPLGRVLNGTRTLLIR